MATALIETPSELDIYFADLMRETTAAIARGLERGLKVTADEIRQDAPPDPPREWNLRAGIGVDDRIPRQKGPIPGFAARQDYEIQVQPGEVTGVIASAMTYTRSVIKRSGDFMAPAIARSSQHVNAAIFEELAGVGDRV